MTLSLYEDLLAKISDPNSFCQLVAQKIAEATGELPLSNIPQANVEDLVDDLAAKLTADQAAEVALMGTTTDLTLDSPVAVDLNAVFSDTEAESAFAAKADQAAVSALVTAVEDRLDDIEAKMDELIGVLKTAGIMAS
jgi:hypothetical protein